MSYIDSYEHSYVGRFVGLPLYHPLQTLDEEGFYANSSTFVLGGGSGEHPLMTFRSLSYCVIEYLKFVSDLPGSGLKQGFRNALQFFETSMCDRYQLEYGCLVNLNFAWDMDTITNFAKLVNNEFDVDWYFTKSEKQEIRNYVTEQIIHIMLGEFVFFTARHVLPADEQYQLIAIEQHISESDRHHLVQLFDAVKVPTPGYRPSGRRHEFREDGSYDIVWGYNFFDEHKYQK